MPQASDTGSYEPSFGKPFWWEAAPPFEVADADMPSRVDALVIGAGFTGLSAALTLSRGGLRAAVLDAGGVGQGASTRNGGHVGAKLRPGIATLSRAFGRERAVALWREAGKARAYIEELVGREGIDCDFESTPRFYGSHKRSDLAKLRETADVLRRELDFPIDVVEPDEQGAYIRTSAYFGGLLDRTTAAFHPAKFVGGLARAAMAAGATIRTHVRVLGINRAGTQYEVLTDRGHLRADQVVVSTNGYSGAAIPYFQRRIIPVGSYVIATEEIDPDAIRTLWPGCRLAIDTRKAASYLRVSPDGRRLIYGGRVAAAEIDPARSAPRLKAVLDRIFPSLASARVSHSWMGFTGFTFDEIPHIGQHDGLHYAMGYCGTSGTSLGTYLGHKIAQKILRANDAETAFDGLPFQGRSFYGGNPWFLSGAVAWYRLRDSLRL